jgi:hypothetical protein
MNNSRDLAYRARNLLTQLFFPKLLPGQREKDRSIKLTTFVEYLQKHNLLLPGRRSREYNPVRSHLLRLIHESDDDYLLFETLELVLGFLVFMDHRDLSLRVEDILYTGGGEKSAYKKKKLCLKGGSLLEYVGDPSSYAYLRDDWRIMTMHGEDDLFRLSCAVFISEWLDSIDVHTSAPEVLSLAVDMSRVAFTYGDYNLAKRICSKIIFSPSAWHYSGPNLMSLFDAHRLHAEAVSFSRVSDGLIAFTSYYENVARRLKESRHLTEDQRSELEIRYDDVLLRTLVRLSLVNSVGALDSSQNLESALKSFEVPLALKRLESRLYSISKSSGSLAPKDDANLRFIFYDTYVRALAVLVGKPEEATKRLNEVKARHFREEHQYEECFRRHGRTPPQDMVKEYRLKTTDAMIRCYRVRRMVTSPEARDNVDSIRRHAALAKATVAKILAPTEHSTMQHTRNLASLLSEYLYRLNDLLLKVQSSQK